MALAGIHILLHDLLGLHCGIFDISIRFHAMSRSKTFLIFRFGAGNLAGFFSESCGKLRPVCQARMLPDNSNRVVEQ